MKRLRLYKLEVEILDEPDCSDQRMVEHVKEALEIHMEAEKVVVTIKDVASLEVPLDEFGHPILAEA
jgi:hypothetical protein